MAGAGLPLRETLALTGDLRAAKDGESRARLIADSKAAISAEMEAVAGGGSHKGYYW